MRIDKISPHLADLQASLSRDVYKRIKDVLRYHPNYGNDESIIDFL